ncbi:tail completion protein gp17 [Phreatobacter sp.]|uniref:tail completion protein gp17 n=1 Tax=Phreatobacter sp. TaxID=1966341 RepID=UPI003F6F9FB2
MSPEIAVGAAVKALVAPAVAPVLYYDYVPHGDVLATPLVALGMVATDSKADRCGSSWDIAFRLHVFGKFADRSQLWTLVHLLRTTLHGTELALAAPYAVTARLRERRSADQNDRLQAFDQAFIDFSLTVSTAP